jgi:hypothetical protein
MERLRCLALDSYRPFMLAAVDLDGARALARWSGSQLTLDDNGLANPPLISSSFYTEQVRDSRTAVFRKLRQASTYPSPVERHLAFHRSHEPARGPYSPCMHRPDARTVSFSWISVDAAGVRFHYVADSPCRGRPDGAPVVLEH